jgi:hypothetical protein
MIKNGLFSLALAAAVLALSHPAAAQNYHGTPKATVQEYGPFPKSNKPVPATSAEVNAAATEATSEAAGKCGNPAVACLFYGGDFLNSPIYPPFLANGLANEQTEEVSGSPYGAAVWIPFTVPAGQTWDVTGLFTNDLSTYGVLDQGSEPNSVAFWSINEEVFAGSAGTVVDSGTSPATSTPTGRQGFSLSEYTIQVTGLSIVLTPGTYWLTVVPVCTNSANPYCEGIFFASDVEYLNVPPVNAFGPVQPPNAAYFDSPTFGSSFEPAYGPVGACAGDGCSAFSAGVLGKIKK